MTDRITFSRGLLGLKLVVAGRGLCLAASGTDVVREAQQNILK